MYCPLASRRVEDYADIVEMVSYIVQFTETSDRNRNSYDRFQTPVPYFLEGTHPLKKGKGMENKLSRGQEYVKMEGTKMKRRN